jgi:CheY-like chemotaxis protein
MTVDALTCIKRKLQGGSVLHPITLNGKNAGPIALTPRHAAKVMRTKSPTPLSYSRDIDPNQYSLSNFRFSEKMTGGRSDAAESDVPDDDKPARRILVVDDHTDSREMTAMLVELAGHESQTAAGGAEAIREANLHHPDAILLDIGLPDMDGYEVCRRLREQDWATEVPIIALSGWTDTDESKDAGFDAHLEKPIDPAYLMDLLSGLE